MSTRESIAEFSRERGIRFNVDAARKLDGESRLEIANHERFHLLHANELDLEVRMISYNRVAMFELGMWKELQQSQGDPSWAGKLRVCLDNSGTMLNETLRRSLEEMRKSPHVLLDEVPTFHAAAGEALMETIGLVEWEEDELEETSSINELDDTTIDEQVFAKCLFPLESQFERIVPKLEKEDFMGFPILKNEPSEKVEHDGPCRQCGRTCSSGDAKCWWCESPDPCGSK